MRGIRCKNANSDERNEEVETEKSEPVFGGPAGSGDDASDAPMLAFAEDATGTGKPVAWIGNQGYTSLQAAVDAASSNATTTIKLGEGVYSLGGTQKVTDKSLTFVGAGADRTTWQIQAPQALWG